MPLTARVFMGLFRLEYKKHNYSESMNFDLSVTLQPFLSFKKKPYFDSPRLDLTVFGLRSNKSKTISQKNLKKIKFYHMGLVNILLTSHKAEKLTISKKNRF
jgi:hypothetical protein